MTSRPLTELELSRMLSHLRSNRNKCLFVLGVKTGFRISELLSITVAGAQEALRSGQLSVPRSNMKGKRRSRSVVLHKDAQTILKEYLSSYSDTSSTSDVVLFPISRVQAYRLIRDAACKAGVRGVVSTHSMRKTFGQCVYKLTNDIVVAQRALGHASLASTTHYLSVGQEEVDSAILGLVT